MKLAQKRDAVLNQKLQFRNKLVRCEVDANGKRNVNHEIPPSFDTTEMSVNEIINGLFNYGARKVIEDLSV